MEEVILTVGPQGSGKSHFCEKVVVLDPKIVLVSRDKILVELFGSVFLDSYSGGHYHAYEVMWKRVERVSRNSKKSKLILDMWNGGPGDRAMIMQKLRSLGFQRIVIWYFVTPVEKVNKWFWKKPGVAKISKMGKQRKKNLAFFSETAPARAHKLFHSLASGIDHEPFDKVVRINPVVVTPRQVLNLQTGLKS